MTMEVAASSERIYLGLGSNMGQRQENIHQAVEEIQRIQGMDVKQLSKIIETKPMGGPPQNKFLNSVLEGEFTGSPQQLLSEIHRIEQHLGRIRTIRWGPRTIDIDILFFGSRTIHTPDLTIPHPRLQERGFVLQPLVEIAPGVIDPISGRTAAQMLERLDQS